MERTFKLLYHYGGKFISEPDRPVEYVGGKTEYAVNIDPDTVDYWWLHTTLPREIGIHETVLELWYLIPGKSMKTGLVKATGDVDVLNICKLGIQKGVVSVFLVHPETNIFETSCEGPSKAANDNVEGSKPVGRGRVKLMARKTSRGRKPKRIVSELVSTPMNRIVPYNPDLLPPISQTPTEPSSTSCKPPVSSPSSTRCEPPSKGSRHSTTLKPSKAVESPSNPILSTTASIIARVKRNSTRRGEVTATRVSPRRTPSKPIENASTIHVSDTEESKTSESDEPSSGNDTSDDEWECARTRVKVWKVTQSDEVRKARDVAMGGVSNEDEARADECTSEPPSASGFVSDYSDTDCSVNTPEGSEDECTSRSRKRVVVDENTDFSKFKWSVGIRFPTREHFKNAVVRYAISQGRNLIFRVSDNSRNQRLGASCVEGCAFYLYGSWDERRACFVVKTAKNQHNCCRNMSSNSQLKSKWIATQFLDVYKAKPDWPARDLQDAVKTKFKVLIRKTKCYKVKEWAYKLLHGSMKEHYAKLGRYVNVLRTTNPTSTFEIVTNPDIPRNPPTFQRFFVCFDGLRKGFLIGCRRVICLDGCFLKTFLGGMLLVAVGRDANNQMYPLAWAAVEGENNDSWEWFLSLLSRCLDGTAGEGFTLISDQQKGLVNAVAAIFPEAEHRNCARHIYANWHKVYKGDELKRLFWKVARASNETYFNEAVEEMKQVSVAGVEALLAQNPKSFCRAFLDTSTKCDVIVNNMAETFNGYIINARSKHLIDMMEDIRCALMERMVTKKIWMQSHDMAICPKIQEALEVVKEKSLHARVTPSTETMYQVSLGFDDEVVVDTARKSCTCRKWDLTGIPCEHAIAAICFMRQKVEDYVHEYYTKACYMKTYSEFIPPLVGERHWPKFEMPLDPPPIKVGVGRPKKNRRKDPHEDPKRPGKLTKHGRVMTCSACSSKEHTKRTCSSIGASSQEPQPKRPRGRPRTRPNQSTGRGGVTAGGRTGAPRGRGRGRGSARGRGSSRNIPAGVGVYVDEAGSSFINTQGSQPINLSSIGSIFPTLGSQTMN